jgi:hypothetical protein
MSSTKDVDCQVSFAYRHKADGSIDSICLTCYLTAATANNEAELHEREKAHDCPGPSSEWCLPYERKAKNKPMASVKGL